MNYKDNQWSLIQLDHRIMVFGENLFMCLEFEMLISLRSQESIESRVYGVDSQESGVHGVRSQGMKFRVSSL
jgi:hypothetical protein